MLSHYRGSTRKHKILCVFFRKQAIELQAVVNPPELTMDDTAMLELPEGLLQLPVSVSLLFIKP